MAFLKKRFLTLAALGMGVTLSGCMGDYGYGGVGYASDYYVGSGYSYGGVYGAPYGTGFYGGGLGGWYNDFYYPGNGVYVFDRSGRRSRWNDVQRRYWQNRASQGRPGFGRPGNGGPRWNGNTPGRPGAVVGRPGYQGRPDRGPGAFQGRPGGTPGIGRPAGQRPSASPWRGGGQGMTAPRRGPDGGGRSWGGQGRGGRPGSGRPQ